MTGVTQSKQRLAVVTSGGDAPGMNAAIRAVVRCGVASGYEVWGVERGYYGLIRGHYEPFTVRSVDSILHRGGTVLRSAREESFKTAEGQMLAVQHLKEENISALIVIGGDGSLAGAETLAQQGIQVIGIPATIDNDIVGTETCIGFDTAINTVIHTVNQLRDTAYSHDRVYVVEVMGRDSGYIALYSGVAAGAEAILIPEEPIDLAEVCSRLDAAHENGKAHSIVIVAEGVGGTPQAARKMSESAGFRVASYINEHTDHETRVTILGHLQRGGSPTAGDRLLASRFGEKAVKLITQGVSGQMVAVQSGQVVNIPLRDVLNRVKPINREYYQLANSLTAIL